MNIAVFSDSHGNSANMLAAVSRSRPDAVIFLGDGVRDAETVRARFPDLPFHILAGNCDYDAPGYADSLLLDLAGVKIFAAHGHNHGVKWGMDKFCNSVWCAGARLGLYGHTHRPQWQEVRGMQLLNPGSVGDRHVPTFGLVTVENGSVFCKIIDIPAE